jgi:hypothetical protein
MGESFDLLVKAGSTTGRLPKPGDVKMMYVFLSLIAFFGVL